jgi:hypothetical protein
MRGLKPIGNTSQCRVSDKMGPNAKGEIQQNQRCGGSRQPAAWVRSIETEEDDKQVVIWISSGHAEVPF